MPNHLSNHRQRQANDFHWASLKNTKGSPKRPTKGARAMESLLHRLGQVLELNMIQDAEALYQHLPNASQSFAVTAKYAMKTIGKVLWGYEVHGQENLERLAEDRGFIIASNHPSYLDGAFLGAALPNAWLRRGSFLSKIELFENKIMAPIMRLAGGIPIDRKGDTARGVAVCKKFLRLGGFLVIFPEGTIPDCKQIISFRRGAARMAIETGVPVVPARIIGAYEIYQLDTPMPRILRDENGKRCKVQVVFGAPLEPPHLPKRISEKRKLEIIDEFTKAIENAVRNLDLKEPADDAITAA